MLFLLSPSKTQKIGASHPRASLPQLLDQTALLLRDLKKLGATEIAESMHISSKLAQKTEEQYAALAVPPPHCSSSPALQVFQGSVFAQIERASFTEEDWLFAQEHMRILSGLYGILRPLDRIQTHRLEMDWSYGGESLGQFWRDHLERHINLELQSARCPVIINLASLEYARVLRQKRIGAKIVTIHFKEEKEGKRRTIAVHAKKARGAMANYIIKNKITTIDGLSRFTELGYAHIPSAGDESTLFFLR
ncbi:unnamed protein product [Cyprideis torosa]|uniref:Uncharacterized protein n=1 Tax=Cyprideis torosa TaxID=163714 RepID=A0A7R8W970_9CRUS|nr:unnamed protein product [Cyprideis torosa]CAG0889449.1 unnamed protein product [Cyprideis torosa]